MSKRKKNGGNKKLKIFGVVAVLLIASMLASSKFLTGPSKPIGVDSGSIPATGSKAPAGSTPTTSAPLPQSDRNPFG